MIKKHAAGYIKAYDDYKAQCKFFSDEQDASKLEAMLDDNREALNILKKALYHFTSDVNSYDTIMSAVSDAPADREFLAKMYVIAKKMEADNG